MGWRDQNYVSQEALGTKQLPDLRLLVFAISGRRELLQFGLKCELRRATSKVLIVGNIFTACISVLTIIYHLSHSNI